MTERVVTGDGGPWLLTQNSNLAGDGIWTWTLPAWTGVLSDGRGYNTCPQAGECGKLCYARQGTYRIPSVLTAHQRNLLMVRDQPEAWEALMTREVAHSRYAGRWVRIHDAGDFYSESYLAAWLRIVRSAPATGFYCYTKAVRLFKQMVVDHDPPVNLFWCFSLGGTEDHLIDLEKDRHADVFPDEETLTAAGYTDQSASDLLAVLGPKRVGIPANNIPKLRKQQAGKSFGELQREADQVRADRLARHAPSAA